MFSELVTLEVLHQAWPRQGLVAWPGMRGLAGWRVPMMAAHSQTWDGAVKSSGKKEVPEVEDESSLDIFSTFSLYKTEK